jgi:hypothetical protein
MQSSRQTEEVAQKLSATENTSNRKQVAAEATLSTGKLNAVRSAFWGGSNAVTDSKAFWNFSSKCSKSISCEITGSDAHGD